MKKLRNLILLLLLFLWCFLAVSCGSKDSSETASETASEPVTKTAIETTSEPATAAATETPAETEVIQPTEDPLKKQAEEISKKMLEFVQSDAEFTFYAILDINGDSIPELLASKETNGGVVEIVQLYVWKNQTITYVDDIWSKYGGPFKINRKEHYIYGTSGGSGFTGFAIYELKKDLTFSYHDYYRGEIGTDKNGNVIIIYFIDDYDDPNTRITESEFRAYEKRFNSDLEEIHFVEIERTPETTASAQNNKLVSVDKEVKKIRDIYNSIQSDLNQMKVQDGGGGATRYIDRNNHIRMITLEPGAYIEFRPDLDKEVLKAEAKYYYDVINGYEQACFVFVTNEKGEHFRFYLKENDDPYQEDSSANCIRYIDSTGKVTDYPGYVNPEQISRYGCFCWLADMEIAWAYEGDY